jgi:hypothetical protein
VVKNTASVSFISMFLLTCVPTSPAVLRKLTLQASIHYTFDFARQFIPPCSSVFCGIQNTQAHQSLALPCRFVIGLHCSSMALEAVILTLDILHFSKWRCRHHVSLQQSIPYVCGTFALTVVSFLSNLVGARQVLRTLGAARRNINAIIDVHTSALRSLYSSSDVTKFSSAPSPHPSLHFLS